MTKKVIIITLAIVGVVLYGLTCDADAIQACGSPADSQEINNHNKNTNLNLNLNNNPTDVNVEINPVFVEPTPKGPVGETTAESRIEQSFESPKNFHIPNVVLYPPAGPERVDPAKAKGTVSPLETFQGIYTLEEIKNMAKIDDLWANAKVVSSMKTKPQTDPVVDEIGAYLELPQGASVDILGELYVRATADDVLNRHLFARLCFEAMKYGATGVLLDDTNKWDDMSSWSIGLGTAGSMGSWNSNGDSIVSGAGTGFNYAQGNYKERAWIKARIFGVRLTTQ